MRGNSIARFAADIKILHANGGNVHDNHMTGGQVSLDLLDGDGMSIYGNIASAATVNGLYVAGNSGGTDASKASNDNVHDNDFRSNGFPDCIGRSAAVATSNGNTFSNNLGDSSNPAALCQDEVDVPT